MSARRAALVVFWLVLATGLTGFGLCLWRYTQLRDEFVGGGVWTVPGRLRLGLEPGEYRLWLLQDPPGEEEDLSFQDFWFAGFSPRATLSAAPPTAEPAAAVDDAATRPLPFYGANGTTAWEDHPQEPVSLGHFRLEEAATVAIDYVQGNDQFPPRRGRVALAYASLGAQDALLRWMMAWLLGGVLGAIVGHAAVAGLGRPGRR